MALLTILTGLVLIGIGAVGYLGTGTTSVTALIPAFLGVPLVLLGILALKDGMRKHAMHLAAMVGLLGAIGAGMRGLPALVTHLNSGESAAPPAMVSQVATTVICALFVAACVNSFVQARRRRLAAAGPTAART